MLKPDTAQNVYDQIVAHIGSAPKEWYAGIAADWNARLFTDHAVPKQGCGYIARQCHNDTDARAVEQSLLKLGCSGGPSGGDSKTVYVYAYHKMTTRP